MHHQKQTVVVHANFREKDALLAYIKRYAQYADDDFAYWDEFAFTTKNLHESDGLLVFNEPSVPVALRCDPRKNIAMMMEPGHPRHHPWMHKGLQQYAEVYSPLGEVTGTSTTKNTIITSHGYSGWFTGWHWPALVQMDVPVKTMAVSCISSDLTQLEGHRQRLHFVNTLRNELPSIDFFGRGIRFLDDKMNGLLDYRYSVAIENTALPFYFTDKINDCFLAYTVPLYYGCSNIGKFFPEKSFIPIDINDSKKAVRQIEKYLREDDWSERLGALQEARELVLNQYQPLAGAANIFRKAPHSSRRMVRVSPVAPGIRKRLSDAWFRFKQSTQPVWGHSGQISKTT